MRDDMRGNDRRGMTPVRRALRIDRRAPGRFVVLLWTNEDNDAAVRVIRQGSVVTLGLRTSDFSRRPLNAVRWAAEHYKVDLVYLVMSRDETADETTCRKYTRRAANKGVEGTVSDPDFQRPGA